MTLAAADVRRLILFRLKEVGSPSATYRTPTVFARTSSRRLLRFEGSNTRTIGSGNSLPGGEGRGGQASHSTENSRG